MTNTKALLLYFAMFFTWGVFAQQPKVIHGKITVKGATAEGIIVLNLVSEAETRTDKSGAFTIMAQPDDLLVFSATHLDAQRKIVEQPDFENGRITIEMTPKIEQLQEVEVVDYKRINAVALGILSRPAKRYTPAERRLKTATSLDPTANAGMMAGGSISLDPLMNWMSGRTKLLKEELKIERNEIALKRLDEMFEPEFYVQNLKIPEQKIPAFRYYCIGDAKFVETLDSKNKIMSRFLIGMLAIEFNALQAHEN